MKTSLKTASHKKIILKFNLHRSLYWMLGVLSMVIVLFNSCKKTPPTKFISGSVQKGPFLNGSTVTLFELNDQFAQTGQSFSAQITDNLGSFSIQNISLSSDFVSLRADGYYFNEVCGENSVAPITLSCIADIQNVPSIHINLLTHLEKPRVEYLLANGSNFIAAKKQAQIEVLSIFNLSSSPIDNSENLDISASGEGNAILLAVTSILQGFRTESELSNILSDISSDIRTDGILNDTTLQSSLIDHALLLDTISIRSNISNYYSKRNVPASIANFEQYINLFINTSVFTRTNSVFVYPTMGINGENLLDKSKTNYLGVHFSLAANLKRCSPLKINVKNLTGNNLGYSDPAGTNWTVTRHNINFFTFRSVDPSENCDIYISGGTPIPMSILIEYFEKDTETVTFSKVITVFQ